MLGKAIAILNDILPFVEEQAEHQGYGFASAVSDPRDFRPDEESCSPQEIQNWKNACELAEKGEYAGGHEHKWVNVGGATAHVSNNPFGIGSYIYRDPEMCELRDRIKELLKEGESA